ncbi:hypothetical protein LWI28_027468 [Acer negundo]|uniref:Uncharacterized protein n=1 Tax=Acer negundo TaxID=4023 RepID=A0AAD5NFR9_ACENE|nr:hypothetical protein LWI28_027468 [Acer negundo]
MATTGGDGVSGGGAEIRGLGEAAVKVVADVHRRRRRRREAGFFRGLNEAASEELEGVVVVVGAEGSDGLGLAVSMVWFQFRSGFQRFSFGSSSDGFVDFGALVLVLVPTIL